MRFEHDRRCQCTGKQLYLQVKLWTSVFFPGGAWWVCESWQTLSQHKNGSRCEKQQPREKPALTRRLKTLPRAPRKVQRPFGRIAVEHYCCRAVVRIQLRAGSPGNGQGSRSLQSGIRPGPEPQRHSPHPKRPSVRRSPRRAQHSPTASFRVVVVGNAACCARRGGNASAPRRRRGYAGVSLKSIDFCAAKTRLACFRQSSDTLRATVKIMVGCRHMDASDGARQRA